MEVLQTTKTISCGVCTGYLMSLAFWNLIKGKSTSQDMSLMIEVEECSSVDTHTPVASLFTDSGDFQLSASHSYTSSGSYVSACESLHDRSTVIDLASDDNNFKNSFIENDHSLKNKPIESVQTVEEIQNCSEIVKVLLRKRPDTDCLQFLDDHDLGDLMKCEIENQIRNCLQRN